MKISAIGLILLLVGCRPSPDFGELRKEILCLHQETIDAHWKKDPAFFAKHMADDYFAVQNGEIRKPNREEIVAEYKRYLASTTFTEYRDLSEPIVGFSKDGSIAWSIVQVKVAGRERDESGGESDFDITWAWITLYGREKGRWLWLGEASNFKRPLLPCRRRNWAEKTGYKSAKAEDQMGSFGRILIFVGLICGLSALAD